MNNRIYKKLLQIESVEHYFYSEYYFIKDFLEINEPILYNKLVICDLTDDLELSVYIIEIESNISKIIHVPVKDEDSSSIYNLLNEACRKHKLSKYANR